MVRLASVGSPWAQASCHCSASSMHTPAQICVKTMSGHSFIGSPFVPLLARATLLWCPPCMVFLRSASASQKTMGRCFGSQIGLGSMPLAVFSPIFLACSTVYFHSVVVPSLGCSVCTACTGIKASTHGFGQFWDCRLILCVCVCVCVCVCDAKCNRVRKHIIWCSPHPFLLEQH